MASQPQLAGPEDLASRALTWFLRGGTFQALARELAWQAARATGGDLRAIEWLTPLLEARLAEAVDALEFEVDMASAAARRDHIAAWPHDAEGADTAATLDGYEAAIEHLSSLYVGELEWAIALVEARRASRTPAAARRRRRRAPARGRTRGIKRSKALRLAAARRRLVARPYARRSLVEGRVH